MLLKRYPFLSRTVLFVFIPLTLFIMVSYVWLVQSLPDENGEIEVLGIKNAISIQYDTFGIPKISSSNDLDAYYGLGFVHGQNRLWQMEMNRRIASGRLSEVLGDRSLSSDIYMRTLGLRKNAQRMWAALPEREKRVLSTYVLGVNEGVKQLSVLPIEYHLLDFKPEAWTEVDSLVWMQLMTTMLGNGMSSEIRRSIFLQAFGRERTNTLLPQFELTEQMEQVHNAIDIAAISYVVPESYRLPNTYVGSNSWVVSGAHTVSGKPILANDPHLSYSLPSIFFLAHLKGDRLNVTGATFPGLPFVVIGKNTRIAWGLTAMIADNEDIFLEKINPTNANQYLVDGKYRNMEVYIEKISIRKKFLGAKSDPYILEVKRTHHGPILSGLFGPHKNYAYALRWTGDDQDGGTFSSFLSLNYAQNWSEFNDALKTFVAPIHNFIYADVDGHIGYVAPGKFPRRIKNNGILPTPGWISENDWQGWIEPENWPSQFNPESGIIVTANNNVLPSDYPFYVGVDWAPPYRAERIENLLKRYIAENGGYVSAENIMAIQMDVSHPSTSSLVPFLAALSVDTKRQEEALNYIRNWNGNADLTSIATTIYTTWMAHFNKLLIIDDTNRTSSSGLGEKLLAKMLDVGNQPFIEKVLLEDQNGWCDYISTETIETCQKLLLLALDHAIDELEKKIGGSMQSWHWGDLHIAQYPHFPFSNNKDSPDTPNSPDYIWSPAFHRSVASIGGDDTVNVGPVNFTEGARFHQFYGASYRQIIDFGNEENTVFSLAGGQSGNLLSRHYDDQLERHQNGKYITMSPVYNKHQLKLNVGREN